MDDFEIFFPVCGGGEYFKRITSFAIILI